MELVVPRSLQMGWCESPPFFCTASETARDIIEELFASTTYLPQHPLEHHALPKEAEVLVTHGDCTLIEVYVDDFIAATNCSCPKHLLHLSSTLLLFCEEELLTDVILESHDQHGASVHPPSALPPRSPLVSRGIRDVHRPAVHPPVRARTRLHPRAHTRRAPPTLDSPAQSTARTA